MFNLLSKSTSTDQQVRSTWILSGSVRRFEGLGGLGVTALGRLWGRDHQVRVTASKAGVVLKLTPWGEG